MLVVGIGASAGGIAALREFFSAMPPDNGMAFAVILHLSSTHESRLAEILQTDTTMRVTQVQETLVLEPNNVYVIPPGKHLSMVDGVVKLVDPEQIPGRRVPIDLLFRTLGDAHGRKAVCIILSGTGTDGTLGLKRIKESGGIAIVQDPEEAEYDEMPRSAIDTHLVDLVLRVGAMPAKLLAIKQNAAKFAVSGTDDRAVQAESDADALREILTLLKIRTGHDFSDYKRPTLLRRLARRMTVHDIADIPAYHDFLLGSPDELQSLLRDLLISVTNFFRDGAAFEALKREIVPKLFNGKVAGDQVRVWVSPCATGEEAYSIAMLLCEFADSMTTDPPTIQIFASDIDEAAIATARAGYYSDSITADVSPERLSRFFVKEDNYYRVKKSLREMVLFAQHNLLRDPPFSRLDLISCRNLLIYLNRKTQQSVFGIFHFALVNNGFLLLGASESAETATALFSVVDKKNRIYKFRPGVAHHRVAPAMPATGSWRPSTTETPSTVHETAATFGEIHHKLVERYASPSVLINDEYDIVHSSRTAARYLRFTAGSPTRNLLKVVHPALALELRAALIEAHQERHATESGPIAVVIDGSSASIKLIVQPDETPDGFVLVTFDEAAMAPADIEMPGADEIREGAAESIVRRLGDELQRTKDRLRAIVEQNETSVEELRASNEELQAINEELRSVSEELETSKEELQSVNEELTTVNHELKDKIEEVNAFASDMQNLMSSTDIGTIFLDLALRIKRYTPAAQALFNIIPSDIGRPLDHLTHKLAYDDLMKDAARVLKTLTMFEREVRSRSGRTYLTRFLPYRTIDDHVEGVVLTFIDINERKSGEESRRWLAAVVSSSNDAIISFTLDRTIASWNAGAERVFGYSEEEVLGMPMSTFLVPDAEQAEIFVYIDRGESIANYETARVRKNGDRIEVSMAVSPIVDADGTILGITATVQDITQQMLAKKILEDANKQKDDFLAMLAHELRNPLMPILTAVDILRHSDSDGEMTGAALSILERQTGQLVHLIDDLLDISRINNGKIKLKLERFELGRAIDMAVETSRNMIDDARHTLSIAMPEAPIEVEADLTRIAQIVTNLLNNAARYTKPGGHILLSTRKVGDSAEIRVKDDGIGIPEDLLATIFDMFKQIEDDQAPTRGGLGIGLGLVRNLLDMHGGSIAAHSDGPGRGSEFVVLLPLAAGKAGAAVPSEPSPRAEPAASAPSKKARRRSRILVVDDNSDSAEMLEMLLALEHFEVRTALNGETAIAAAREFRPDTCLLDIGLPDITGYELARRIRQTVPQTLLIAVTGLGQDEDRRRALEAGFDYHLVKPIRIAELKGLLAEA